MSKTIIVASIGRCVGSEPMSPADWCAFKTQLFYTVDGLAETVLQRPLLVPSEPHEDTQVGVWANVACESAATVMAVIDRDNLPRLRTLLSALAALYRQDAIGLIVSETGTDTLVTADQQPDV